jgi:hypothetical protein
METISRLLSVAPDGSVATENSGVGEWNYRIGGQSGEYTPIIIMILAIIAVVLIVHHIFE